MQRKKQRKILKINNIDLKDWDIIYQQRDEYIKKYSYEFLQQHVKTFIDVDNIEKCSQCGVSNDIHKCFECVNGMKVN